MWKKTEGDEPQTPYIPQTPVAAAPPRNPAPAKSHERALIGPSIFIKGELTGDEDLLIEGQVEGKIEFKKNNVTVGKNGRVKADIYGKTISVEGDVQGNLYGDEQLVLRQSSNVRGNITASRVTLEDGCHFKGSIDMCPKETAETRPSPASGSDPITYRPPKVEKIGEPAKSVAAAVDIDHGLSHK
jgi:cytoskeletal protein CcmA (bactofilin family)